jgi:hypothetical protein
VTGTDPFHFDDAAYVLGALAPEDRMAFEDHLLICDDCAERVGEIDDIPALLAGIDPSEVEPERTPDTLLPSLLRAASRRRRRQRFTVGAIAAVAAACVAALVVALWPSSTPSVPRREFVAIAQVPVRADAAVTSKTWGTAIDLHCYYVRGTVDRSHQYALVVVDRHGASHRIGDWELPPDRNIDYQTGTALSSSQIAKLEITLPDGTPLLQLAA